MLKVYACLGVAAVAALMGGTGYYVWAKQSADQFAQCRNTVIAGGAGNIGGEFLLTDQTGTQVNAAQVIDKPSLVYFGYTFCPDVCPVDVARNIEVVDALEEQGYEVNPVFISIDPERDTPEVLAEYAEIMHPRLKALTGTPEQIRDVAKKYAVYYKAQEKKDDLYLVDHMTFTYLIDPKAGFLDFFKREMNPEEMVEKIGCFLDQK